MLSKTNIFARDWVDLVFDNRNHAYGAFVLRKDSGRNTMLAVLSTIVFFGIALSAPIIINYFKGNIVKAGAMPTNGDAPLTVIEYIDPTLPEEQKPNEPNKPKQNSANGESYVVGENKSDVVDTFKHNPEDPFAGNSTDTTGNPGPLTDKTDTTEGKIKVVGNGDDYNGPITWTEIMPEFPGGYVALSNFIKKNLKYPPIALENGIQGKVTVAFVVERDGSLSNLSIKNDPYGYGLEDEASRVVKIMPRFNPGLQNGRAVRVWYAIPINFKIR